MFPFRHAAIAVGAVLVVPGGAGPVLPSSDDVAAVCDRFTLEDGGSDIVSDELDDISGLAASRAHPGVLWAVNDRGGTIGLAAIDESGRPLGTYSVDGVEHRDWEAVSVGPGPEVGRSYLYIGDLGDNENDRTSVSVVRVPEPLVAPNGNSASLVGATVVDLLPPDGPTDIEAMVVDPDSGQVVMITKVSTGDAEILTIEGADFEATSPVTMKRSGIVSIDLPDGEAARAATRITSADVSPDGSVVAVRTYADVRAFLRPDGMSVATALTGPSCSAPVAREVQGEALAFSADGSHYLTVSEVSSAIEDGRLPAGTRPQIHRVAISPPVGAGVVEPAPVTPANDDTRRMLLIGVAGGVAVLSIVAIVGFARTRRRR